jgi:hypothetical protein
MVAAIVLAHLLPRLRSRAFMLILAFCFIGTRLFIAHISTPLVVQEYPEYALYTQIANDPGDYALLEVPFGVRSGLQRIGSGGEVVQYYQHVHGKRLINGSMARLPGQVFDFYESHPSLMLLSGEQSDSSPDELVADFAEVLRWSEARYVLVHHALLGDRQSERIERFLDQQPALKRLGVELDLVVYCVVSEKCSDGLLLPDSSRK